MTWIDLLWTGLVQILIYPGLMFIIMMIIITQWIYRKIGGRIQYRRGPCHVGPFGILQPFADFMKLLLKEDVVTRYSMKKLPLIVASLGLGALIAILVLTPISPWPLMAPNDIIVFFYLALWASLAIMILGLATPNPYTSLGVGRYMALLASSEPAFIASFLVPVVIASSIYGAKYSLYITSLNSWALWSYSPASFLAMIVAAIAGFLAMMGVLEIKPFDFPEAEGEIYWGVFTEYGGPRLAFGFFILFTERIVIPLIYTLLFLGGPWPVSMSSNPVLGVIIIFAKFFALFIILSIIDNIMPRYTPSQAVRILWKYPLVLSIIALVIALALVY